MGWIAFDQGRSLGTQGSEGGVIQRDEEHTLGARITLEAGSAGRPWSITCGIYGWMFHTRFLGSKEEGDRAFETMKAGLEGVLQTIPLEDAAAPDATAAACVAIEAFVTRYP